MGSEHMALFVSLERTPGAGVNGAQGEGCVWAVMHRKGLPDHEEIMLAAAAMKLLPIFWHRLLSETARPSKPWVVPLSYGPLNIMTTLEVTHSPDCNPILEERRFELIYPAVPCSDFRGYLPGNLVQVSVLFRVQNQNRTE